MQDKGANRFMELEGLRGIAAIVVVLYHNLFAFYALMILGGGSSEHSPLERFLHGNPLATFLSGTFAVAIFFVLSGFVLSIGWTQTKRTDIIKRLAAKRYLRLALPALVSILLCYILIKIGWSHTQDAGAITRSDWLLAQWNFAPHLPEAIRSGLFGIFIDSKDVYNNVLWTMTTEFGGSFLVFGSLLLFGKSPYRWIPYCMLVITTFNTWYMGFVVGMILADLYSTGYIVQRSRGVVAVVILLCSGLFLGGYPVGSVAHTIYSYFSLISFKDLNYVTVSLTMGAALLVFVVLWSAQVAKVLSSRYVSRVGKYTFALYLVHIPILYSYTTWVFTHLSHHMGYNRSALLAIISSVPLVMGATYFFEKYVDQKSIMFATFCTDIFYAKRDFNIKKAMIYSANRMRRFGNATYRRIRGGPYLDVNEES